jgi:phospholipid/cholesterol/gamma-HCH transport system substrate-binding protein
MPPVTVPLLPVAPPPTLPGAAPVSTSSQVFAGPYGAEAPPDPAAPAPPAPAAPAPGGGG